MAVLVAGFAWPLWHLARFAAGSDLYSYILVIPLASAGLVWLQHSDRPGPSAPLRPLALGLLAAGAFALAASAAGLVAGTEPAPPDTLILPALAFVLFFAGICAWFLGRLTVRAIAFPLVFLVFLSPLPLFLSNAFEFFLQHASASVAGTFFDWSGLPVLREGDLGFRLTDINLNVAPQCSGLHSSLALIITSLPAGYLFLRSPWHRAIFTLATIPIGIVRNGFRIFTVGELCVHYGPQMINSYIHRTGGWLFFLLSLVPFFLLLVLLMRLERGRPEREKSRSAENILAGNP